MPMFHEQMSPLLAPPAVCSTCGSVMQCDVKKNKQGVPQAITYSCRNPISGCWYFVESDQRISSMMQPLAAEAAPVELPAAPTVTATPVATHLSKGKGK